jgi:acyl dehydratase
VSETLSETRILRQTDFDAFAQLSGDDNPIHVNPAVSAQTKFGRTVAHGMLLYALLRALAEKLSPGRAHASAEIMFPAPTYADDALQLEAALSADGGAIDARVLRNGDGVTTCQARFHLAPI